MILDEIEQAVDAGNRNRATVDAAATVKAGVPPCARGRRLVGMGELKAKLAFGLGASKSAVAAVEKAGGPVTILAPQKPAEEEKTA